MASIIVTSLSRNFASWADHCNVTAAGKYEGSTLRLVHSTRCRPGLTHVRNIPFELLWCISCQVAGPEDSLVIMVHSLSGMSIEESERLAFGQIIVFTVLSS